MSILRRVVRAVVVVLLGYALYSLLLFISLDSFAKILGNGDEVALAAIMFFALWAWWYGEDRDRRRAAKTARSDGRTTVDGDGR